MKIGIYDDDRIFLEEISNKIKTEFEIHDFRHSMEIFNTKDGLMSKCKIETLDALFLSVSTHEKEDFEVAEKIKKHYNIPVIFISSHNKLVYDIFQYEPYDFIRKNKIDHNISKIINRLIKDYKKKKIIVVGCVDIKISDVLYIESEKHYLLVHTVDYCQKIRGCIKDKENDLSEQGFIQVHKCYLVNMKKIKKFDIEYSQIILENRHKIPISRTYKKDAKIKYDNYLVSSIKTS